MISRYNIFLLISAILLAGSCSIDPAQKLLPHELQGFPEVVYPEGNEFTEERFELGKSLFYEKRLSIDGTISCGSCHKQQFAFADNKPLSNGVKNRPGVRNVPSLGNVAFHPYYTREGGVPSLEMQVLVPIQEHNEFDFNIVDISIRLDSIAKYREMALAAYGRTLDPFVITHAIATFERSLISGSSAYDHYISNKNPDAISEEAKRGIQLFLSESAGCSACHSGFNFSNYEFENNGLYENYPDEGRRRLTGKQEDLARFKVPSLRNVALTAPYMHDGSLKTLEDVVKHYNSGGYPHLNKSNLVRPLHLSNKEVSELIAFLETLSDIEFINNNKFKQ